MKLKCRDHQWVDWQGHVVCSECNRVYQTKDDELPHFAPMVCVCGVKLMPDKDGGRKKFSARSCCPECFEREVSAPLIH